MGTTTVVVEVVRYYATIRSATALVRLFSRRSTY